VATTGKDRAGHAAPPGTRRPGPALASRAGPGPRPVARHGRPARRRSWRGPAAAAALLGLTAVGLAAVSLSTAGARRAATADALRAATQPRPARHTGARAATVALTFCRAAAAPALRDRLDRSVPGSGTAELQPLGVTADGRAAYVSAWTSGFTGVGLLTLATGKLTPIRAFRNPTTDQADGTADGQWLVWAQTYSLSSLDKFTIYAYNAATGRLRRLGTSIAGPHGKPWPSPWHAPAVSGHYAAWAQGYGPGGRVEIRLADLATGTVTTIRTGHTQPPFFDGNLVVWPESDQPNTQTTLRAYSPARHRLVPLPQALRAVHGTEFVATDGTRTAYLSPSLTQLYYSPSQNQPARLALSLPAGATFADLAMSPGTLAWTTSQATYLASTKTGAFAQVTPRYGYATGSGSVVLVTDAPGQKQVHPALPLHVINPAALSWPSCSAAAARR
jgi:hypothetical protein